MPSAESLQTHARFTQDLIQQHFSVREGQLQIGQRSVTELAQQWSTPCYVYSQRLVEAAWHRLRATYPLEVRILYSMKANPHPAFLEYFLDQGAGIEIASDGEMQGALRAGCPAADLTFAGPGKTDAELGAAVQQGVGEIHVESSGELTRLARIASELGRQVKVALRVNPNLDQPGSGAMQMGARATQFGIDEDQLWDVVDQADAASAIQLVGLHVNVATQTLSAESILCQYRHALQLTSQVGERLARPLSILNLGGGLGIPYYPGQLPLQMAHLAEGLVEIIRQLAADRYLSQLRLVIEPGRYLVAESGVYLTRVVDRKVSRGQTFIVLDGGMHHHLAASGNFGQTLKRPFPMAVVNRCDETPDQIASVVGPLCTPLDTMARNVLIPNRCRPGDLFGIFQSGAYALTASPQRFLGHHEPAEVMQ